MVDGYLYDNVLHIGIGQLNLVRQARGPQPLIGDKPPPSDPFWAAPILSHGLLYIRGDDRLVCLELIPQ